jgi:predicted nucleotidyltransferase
LRIQNTRMLPFTADDIIKASGVLPHKVRAIYLYGSRVYGTAKATSDYDIIYVSAHLLEHEEKRATVNGALLNIHIITPDKFKADLKNHDIMNLECFYAPDFARIFEKEPIPFELNKKRLIKNNLAQSYSAWQNGKRKIKDFDIHKGVKGIFHSLRMLMFADQILNNDKIVDYGVANALYTEITESDDYDWDDFKEKYLPLKQELEGKLLEYGKTINAG